MIEVIQGDITTFTGDAIVNAANAALCGGGGVDGAIHREAGPELLEACRRLGGCDTGSAKITGGYELRAKKIIHAVGPVWRDGDSGESEDLRSCYRACLDLCRQHGLQSVAFPNISCGAYRFPNELACQIAIEEVVSWTHNHPNVLNKIVFYCFEKKLYRMMQRFLNAMNSKGA